ncbi:MAG TPA: TetR/AcrR family transcriptional regulator [Gemmatimonadaceae bacterium]|nr:TetR/AcrR family transcriptional regulator [Gemmatimonadaceae bacterium]
MIADTANPEPKWRRLPEERPRQIIEAALEVFSEHGLAAARLEDIAKLAGVSKGTIYLYFPNKEALFSEMVREMVGESITSAEIRITGGTDSAADKYASYMSAVWDQIRSPTFHKLHRIVEADLKSYPALMQFFFSEISLRSMSVAAGIIRQGIESGEFRDVDPDAATRIHHAVLIKHGVWCGKREQVPFVAHLSDEQVLEQLLDFMLHSILRTPPSPQTAPPKGAGE